MLKRLILLLVFASLFQSVQAQIKYINRKVAQKNYDGYMLMQDQKYDSALLIFNDALQADPEAFFIYQNRALCKLYLKDTTGSITDFKINIQLDSTNSDSKYALGNIYKHRKDSLNALRYYIPSINQADENLSQKKLLYMSNFVGHYFRIKEKYDSALIYYSLVKKYTPENASVFINTAVCNFWLDSIGNFCADLEQAFILGGDISCISLKAYCNGCNHLLAESGPKDTLSNELDSRLWGIIPDTVYHPARSYKSFMFSSDNQNGGKKTVYYNKLWQICLEEDAAFYRESLWAPGFNFYYGEFTDYYVDSTIYANGEITRRKLNGSYTCYYPDGTLKLRASFKEGNPMGNWTYYLENGQPDFTIKFFFDEFTLKILDESNPNFHINSGNGKFKILLDKWDIIEFTISGELVDNKKNGKWFYEQNARKIISETYKRGVFKRGTMLNDNGQSFVLPTSIINSKTFIPPQVTQVRNLYFDSTETIKHYSFIKMSSF